jgi:hypothetical protein
MSSRLATSDTRYAHAKVSLHPSVSALRPSACVRWVPCRTDVRTQYFTTTRRAPIGCVAPTIAAHPLTSHRTGAPCEDHVWFEDRWMVASLCDERLTTSCGLILG